MQGMASCDVKIKGIHKQNKFNTNDALEKFKSLSLFLVPFQSFTTPPLPLLVLRARSVSRAPNISVLD
jgi:hypothetical protein